MPDEKDVLINMESDGAKAAAQCFRMNAGILSLPSALRASSLTRKVNTSSTLVAWNSRKGSRGDRPQGRDSCIGLLGSETTPLNCSLSTAILTEGGVEVLVRPLSSFIVFRVRRAFA